MRPARRPRCQADNLESVLTSDLRPYRKDLGHSYALGTQAVRELLTRRPADALALLLHPRGSRSESIAEAVARAEELGVPVRESERIVRRLARNDSIHLIAAFRRYQERLDRHRNHVVLVEPAEFGNLGTILRTALGFGLEDVALIGAAVDDLHPRVVRASMGARFAVRVERFAAFERYLERGERTSYLFVARGGMPLPEVAFERPLALVFGPEGAGLDPELARHGTQVTIPQRQGIDSFNLAVAVGVALYQVDRT